MRDFTTDELKNAFPQLNDKSEKYIEGFKEALKKALSKDSGSGQDTSADSPLQMPPKLYPQEADDDQQSQESQESDSENNQNNQSQNSSDSQSSSQNQASEEEPTDSSNNNQNHSDSPRIGEFNPKDLDAARELRDAQASEAEANNGASQEDDQEEVSGADIINNTMDQAERISNERQAEQQRVTAQQDEINRWRRDPINQFKQSVKNFFSEEDDERVNSITVPNTRRDVGDPDLVVSGRWKIPKGGIPKVNIYFDQANSNSQRVMDLGEQALSALRPYEERNLLKTDLFYFAANVHKEDRHSLANRGYTWPDGDNGAFVNPDAIIDHIRQTHADNVIILTDHNLDNCHSKIIIPGAVWIFFYQGAQSSRFISAIKGKKLNKYWIL